MRRFGIPLTLALPLTALALVPAAADEPAPAAQPAVQPVKRVPPRRVPATPTAPQLSDEEALKKAGLPSDDPKPLIEYLKTRTLTDVDQTSIGELIQKFAADDFQQRVKAEEDIEKFGPAAIGPLKAAEKDAAPEVAYRAAQALKRMEKVPHTQVAAAAVRALVKLRPKEAAATLVGFLPMADSEEVADVIRAALVELAVAEDGKPEPALVRALSDKSVVRRSAAYLALTEGGAEGERIRVKDAYPLVKDAVRKEENVDAKFNGLWSLLLTTREKEFVPDLLEMIPKLPRGRIWQLEEFLLQAAGDKKPAARFGKSAESLAKARDAWSAWWKDAGGKFDLAKFDFKPRITGYTDVAEFDPRYGMFLVVTLGPDLKEKNRLGGERGGVNALQFVGDVMKLPNGNYLVAEMNNSRVTERDAEGKIVKQTQVNYPLSVDLLPDGGVVVVGRNQVLAFDKDMKQKWSHNRAQYDIMAGRRLPNGDVVFVTNNFQAPNQTAACHRLGAKDGKPVGKEVAIGRVQQQHSMDVSGDNKILVCEFNRVVEYDLSEEGKAKEVWKFETPNPTCCQSLPNGNVLLTLPNNNGRAAEVDRDGETLWEYTPEDGYQATRAYRR